MDYSNKPSKYYENIRTEMLAYFPKDAKTVLDVGCGNGAFAEFLKKKENIEVWGIEFMNDFAKEAEKKLDKVYTGKCEDFLDDLPDNYFDAIYFNDVIEHLENPDAVLSKIKQKLSKRGVVISSIPNMRYFKVLFNLVFKKDWQYQDHGVMDKTHLRWFTKKSIRRLYEEEGFEILNHEGINISKSLKPYLFHILTFFTHYDMQYFQYATVAKYKK